jgi:hypothetical protein
VVASLVSDDVFPGAGIIADPAISGMAKMTYYIIHHDPCPVK